EAAARYLHRRSLALPRPRPVVHRGGHARARARVLSGAAEGRASPLAHERSGHAALPRDNPQHRDPIMSDDTEPTFDVTERPCLILEMPDLPDETAFELCEFLHSLAERFEDHYSAQ